MSSSPALVTVPDVRTEDWEDQLYDDSDEASPNERTGEGDEARELGAGTEGDWAGSMLGGAECVETEAEGREEGKQQGSGEEAGAGAEAGASGAAPRPRAGAGSRASHTRATCTCTWRSA